MSLPARFMVPVKDGKPNIPQRMKVLDCTVRGNMAEIVVGPKAARYLRERRYAAELEIPKRHISVSQVNAYLRCPLRYYWRYVEGISTPPTSAMSFGAGIHKAIEANNRHKAVHGEDLPIDDVQDAWSDAWNDAAERTAFDEGEDSGAIKDEGIRAVELYMREIAPTIQPVLVEHVFEIDLGDSHTLKGIIDCVTAENIIIDSKTTKRTPSGDPTRNNLQLAAYSIAHREILGMPEAGVRLDYIIRTKTPKVMSFCGESCSEFEVKRSMKLISATARAVRLGVFMPNPTNFSCNPSGCGYWDICHDQW